MIGEIKKATLKLEKGEKGWVLNIVEGESILLEVYYGRNIEELTLEEKEFFKGKTFEEVKTKIISYSQEHEITLKFVGNDLFVASKRYLPNPINEEIDLKWALWTPDESTWNNYAPGVLSKIKDAFEGNGAEVRIHTAPQKEIRYGDVVVQEGGAKVKFMAIWDSPYDLIPEECPEEYTDELRDIIIDYLTEEQEGFYEDVEDPIGALVEKTIEATSFEELMSTIDLCESELLEEEERNSALFHEMLERYFTFKK